MADDFCRPQNPGAMAAPWALDPIWGLGHSTRGLAAPMRRPGLVAAPDPARAPAPAGAAGSGQAVVRIPGPVLVQDSARALSRPPPSSVSHRPPYRQRREQAPFGTSLQSSHRPPPPRGRAISSAGGCGAIAALRWDRAGNGACRWRRPAFRRQRA